MVDWRLSDLASSSSSCARYTFEDFLRGVNAPLPLRPLLGREATAAPATASGVEPGTDIVWPLDFIDVLLKEPLLLKTGGIIKAPSAWS
jgi:hypothetical protein